MSENQEAEEIKSQPKGVKLLKPASFRVREAAEGVLSYIMDHVGAFPSPCGPASCSSLLDEDILMEFLAEEDQVILETINIRNYLLNQTFSDAKQESFTSEIV